MKAGRVVYRSKRDMLCFILFPLIPLPVFSLDVFSRLVSIDLSVDQHDSYFNAIHAEQSFFLEARAREVNVIMVVRSPVTG